MSHCYVAKRPSTSLILICKKIIYKRLTKHLKEEDAEALDEDGQYWTVPDDNVQCGIRGDCQKIL